MAKRGIPKHLVDAVYKLGRWKSELKKIESLPQLSLTERSTRADLIASIVDQGGYVADLACSWYEEHDSGCACAKCRGLDPDELPKKGKMPKKAFKKKSQG